MLYSLNEIQLFYLKHSIASYIFFGFIGAICASFISAMSYRLAMEFHWKDILFGRSKCTKCNTPIPVYALIPVFGYFITLCKCKFCQTKIPIRYICLELCFAAFFIFLYHLEPSFSLLTILLIVFCTLVTITIVDLMIFIIPDSCVAILFICGLFYIPIHGLIYWQQFANAIICAGLFFTLGWIVSKIKNTEALGFGDVKLIFVFSLFLEWFYMPVLFMLAGILGLITYTIRYYMTKPKQGTSFVFAFAPPLSVGFFLLILLDNYFSYNLIEYFVRFWP